MTTELNTLKSTDTGIPLRYQIIAQILKKPRCWLQLNGGTIPAFTLVDVARMLNREPLTLRLWERGGLLPPPKHRARNWRLYTMDEVNIIIHAYETAHGARHYHLSCTPFFQIIREEFNRLNNGEPVNASNEKSEVPKQGDPRPAKRRKARR